MHILFLTDNFPPEVNAPASRTFEHCREWVRSGHQITVITCAPNFPKGKVFDGYRNRIWQTEEMDGIRVIRVWSYISRNEGFGRRILDYLSYMLSAFIASFFVRKVDIIVGTSPQFFTTCAAYAASLFKRKPWVFELRDLWPESIGAVGAIKRKRILDGLERLELFLYRKSDAIVSVTHAFKRNLIKRGIPEEKIHVVTNGVDTSRFKPQAKDEELADRLGIKGYFTAGYIGTHGMAHGLDTLINAAHVLQTSDREDRFRLILLGDGANRRHLQDRATAMGLHNALFIGSVSKEEVVRYWSLLDASIIHLKKSDLFKTVIPSKMFECMGMSIPILHGVEGESAEIVTRHQIGLTFEPENEHSLIERLYQLHDNHELRARLSRNGPLAAATYDRRKLALSMLKILEQISP